MMTTAVRWPPLAVSLLLFPPLPPSNPPPVFTNHASSREMWHDVANSRQRPSDYINCGRFHERFGEYKKALEQYHLAAENAHATPYLRLKIAACNAALKDSVGLIHAIGGDFIQSRESRDQRWNTAMLNEFPDAEDVDLSNEVFCGAMESAVLIAERFPAAGLELAIAAMDSAIESRAAESVGYFAGCLAKLLQSFNNTAEEAYYWFKRSTPQHDGDYCIASAKAHYQVGDIKGGSNMLLEAMHANENTPDANVRDKLREIYHAGVAHDFQDGLPSCPMELHKKLDGLNAKYKRDQSYFANVHERFAQVYETLLQLPVQPFQLTDKLAAINDAYHGDYSGTVLFCGEEPIEVAKLINRLLGDDIIPCKNPVDYSCSIQITSSCSRFYTVRTTGTGHPNVRFICHDVKQVNKIIDSLLAKGILGDFDFISVTGPFTRFRRTKSFLFATGEYDDVETATITTTYKAFDNVVVVGNASDKRVARKYERYAHLISGDITNIHLFLLGANTFTAPVPVAEGQCFLDDDLELPGFVQLKHVLAQYNYDGEETAKACLKAVDALMNQAQITMRIMESIQAGHAIPSTFINFE